MKLEDAIKSGIVKLNVGSGIGGAVNPDFVNIDVVDHPKIDLVCDITKGIPIEDGKVTYIECMEVLEHLHRNSTSKVLEEFYRILKIGGRIKLSVPNLPVILDLWLRNVDGKRWEKWLLCLFGGQVYPSDTHLTGFDKERLTKIFEDGGKWSSLKTYENGEYNRQLICEAIK